MFPTPEQELLLQVAFRQRDVALHAWQQWKMRTNLDLICDSGTHRLLPLVYHQLRSFGEEDPEMGKLRGIYRKEWYKNQILFHTITDVLHLFHTAGIETMILKGAALTLVHYKDYGLRPMTDFAVLISPLQRGMAIDVLKQADWIPIQFPVEKLVAPFLDARHAWGFEDLHQHQFDLQWYLLADWCDPNADDDFWADAIPIQVGEVLTRILNPTDQLLDVCVSGIGGYPTPSVQWIADAMVILNGSYADIDWSHLIFRAEKRHTTILLQRALTYLRDIFGVTIPSYVMTDISRVRVLDVERKLYNAAIARPTLLGGLPYHWCRHLFELEMKGEKNWVNNVFSFPRYLQRVLVMDKWQLLRWAIKKTAIKVSHGVRIRV